MRFARKLALALWVGICLIYGINGAERFRREAELFETDIQRDHEVMGRGIVAAVAEVWEDEGKARALDIIERANQRESQVLIRWVDLGAPPSGEHAPTAPAVALLGVGRGEIASWTDATGAGRLYSYVPVGVDASWIGAIELSETLQPEREYLRESLLRMVATSGSLALMAGAVAMGLGALFVGRPIRLLVEKARRVGAGDFSGDLVLQQRDELGELAAEMNAMSSRLAAARASVEAETAARAAAMAQLQHAERLTTVGKLASGVAHELGTPLNVIGVRAKMIADGEVAGQEARDGALVVVEQVERITRIVRQLLDFARRRTPERGPHEVATLVERTFALLSPLARRASVEMSLAAAPGGARALIDPVQVQQVLANLVMNGIQAMPGGGRLEVRVEPRVAAPPAGLGEGERPVVAVTVSDEGAGMDEATRAQAFDPFFTTKRVGEGTGLGLSVAYGIVREHDGWIEVDSEPGRGSRFTVFLPGAGT